MNGIMSILAVGLGLLLPATAVAQGDPPPEPPPAVQVALDPEPAVGPGDERLATEPVTVTLTAPGATAIRYSVDGGEDTTYAEPFVLDEGRHELSFFAVNEAEEQGPPGSVVISVDLTAPLSSATLSSPAGPARNGYFRGPVDVVLAADDPGEEPTGVAAIEQSVTGQGYQPYEGPVTVRVPDGSAGPITYRARDAAGNEEELKSLRVRIDDDAPTTTIAARSGRATLTARDPESGVAAIFFSVGAGSEQRYRGSFAIPPGTHLVHFRAVDRAGNLEGSRVVSVSGPPLALPPILPPPPPPRPPVAPAAPPPRAPAPVARVARAAVPATAQISGVLRRGFAVRVTCHSRCRAAAKLIVRSRGRRAARPVEIARTARSTTIGAGRTGVVRLRSRGRAKRRLLALTRTQGSQRAAVVIRTTFADGFTLTLTHGVRLGR